MNTLGLYALQFVGKEYIYGGNGPYFDCSGFVLELLKAGGIRPPHDMSAQQIFDWLRPSSQWDVKQFGSIVFFGRSLSAISHVAFCLDAHRMLEAGGGDHTTVSFEIARKQGAFIRIRPITNRKDFAAILLPTYENNDG